MQFSTGTTQKSLALKEILGKIIFTKIYSVNSFFSALNSGGNRENRKNWTLIIKYEGETIYKCNGKQYISNSSNIALLPMGSSYEWKSIKEGYFYAFEFDCPLSCEDIFTIRINNLTELVMIINKIQLRYKTNNVWDGAKNFRDAYLLLLAISKNFESEYLPKRKEELIQPAVKYISAHLGEQLYNDKLASVAGISTIYFRKLFKAVFNVTPMQYVKQLRIQKAKEMLQSDFGTITDLSISLGYESIYDFSRDFKLHVGISPLKYSKRMLQ